MPDLCILIWIFCLALYSSLAIVIYEMVVRCGGIALAWDTPRPGEKEILSTQSRLLDGGGRVGHKREPKVRRSRVE